MTIARNSAPRRFALTLSSTLLTMAVILTGCKSKEQMRCADLAPAQPSATTLTVLNEDLETVQSLVLKTPEAQEEWRQKNALVSPESDWGGWVTMLRTTPGLEMDPSVENPIRLPTDTEANAFLLVRNAWKKPHSLRIVFLIDFQQASVTKSEQRTLFYDFPIMEPQEDRTIEFTLPALSRGFHQLSTLFVTDPDNVSTDTEYRYLQQHSFSEQRYDLWVDTEARPKEVMTFESAELGRAAGSRMGGVEFVVSPDDKENKPLTSLTLKPGEEHCLNLRLYNAKSEVNAPYTGPVPLRIAVFWNDKMEQVLDYDLLADAPDNLTLQLKIQAPSEAGSYQLSAVVFTFPGYSQFEAVGERTGYPGGAFSRRSLVEVQP